MYKITKKDADDIFLWLECISYKKYFELFRSKIRAHFWIDLGYNKEEVYDFMKHNIIFI